MAHAPTDLLAADFFKDGESRPLKFGKSFLNDASNKDEHISIMCKFQFNRREIKVLGEFYRLRCYSYGIYTIAN